MATERRRRILLGTSSGYAGILVTNLIGVVTVPATLGYFGADRYGALALVMTLVNYLSVTNFGIPTACAMLASKSVDRREQLAVICRSFLLLSGISLVTLVCFLMLQKAPGVNLLGQIPAAISGEVSRTVFWTALLFLLNLPCAPLLAGFIAQQQVHVERFYAALITNSYVVALAATILLKGTLADYALARGVLVLLCSALGALHFLFGSRENRRILGAGVLRLLRETAVPEFTSRAILFCGSRMFVSGLAALVVWQTDNLVISHYLGIGAVTPYQVTLKLVTMLFILFTAVNPAISPHYGRAWATGDFTWIGGTYNHIARVSAILGGLVWIGSLAFAQTVINLWTGPVAYGGELVVFSMGGYGFLLSLVSVHAALLSAMNMVRNLPLLCWLEAGANLGLSLLLVRVFGMGGVALGTFLASLLTVFWMIPREIGARSEGKVVFDWRPLAVQCLTILLPSVLAVLLVNHLVAGQLLRLLLNLWVVAAYLVASYLRLPCRLRELIGELAVKPVLGLLRRNQS